MIKFNNWNAEGLYAFRQATRTSGPAQAMENLHKHIDVFMKESWEEKKSKKWVPAN